MRSGTLRTLGLLCVGATLCLASLSIITPSALSAAVICKGDCDDSGLVDLGEVQASFQVFLGNQAPGFCPAADADGSGDASLGEVQKAFNTFLDGCNLTIDGTCLKPGPEGTPPPGLVNCDENATAMQVRVFACDLSHRDRCLNDDSTLVVLGFASLSSGHFSLTLDGEMIAGRALVLEAEVDPSSHTVYRTVDLSFAGTGASLATGGGSDVTAASAEITPVTETAVQLIDQNGFANYYDSGITDVFDAVEQATTGLSFSGLTAETGASLALDTAADDANVVDVLASARSTPTPTRTPIPTRTPTPTGGRFVDNGDGTLTDSSTGLMWEKQFSDNGVPGGLHDPDNQFHYAGVCSPFDSLTFCQTQGAIADLCSANVDGNPEACLPCSGGKTCTGFPGFSSDFTTVWRYVSQLNDAGFAGHTDWRVPTGEELVSINASEYYVAGSGAFNRSGCASGCTDILSPTCSCYGFSGFAPYWSSTILEGQRVLIAVAGIGSNTSPYTYINDGRMRAVRGGP